MTIKRIAVIGLGNIGGSIALAVCGNEAADVEVVGYARNQDTASEAIRIGAVDRASVDLADVLAGADLVVLANPGCGDGASHATGQPAAG